MIFVLCFIAGLAKINLGLKTYGKVSSFALKVNFSILKKNLVAFVTTSIYCTSFYCRVWFY